MEEKNNSTVETLVDELRHDILEGRYPVGYRLREVELSRKFGVSRTPVREALRILNASGLIDIVPHKGAVISEQLSEKRVADTFVVWRILSAESGMLAAENATDEQRAELEALIHAMEKLLDPDQFRGSEARQLDWAFHIKIAEASGNRTLKLFTQQIQELLSVHRDELAFRFERYQRSVIEHRNIADAILRRDPRDAFDYSQIHFRHSEESNRRKVQEHAQKLQGENI